MCLNEAKRLIHIWWEWDGGNTLILFVVWAKANGIYNNNENEQYRVWRLCETGSDEMYSYSM
jgi:hypothetical protein